MFDTAQSGHMVLSEPLGSPDEHTTSSSASSQLASGPAPPGVQFRVVSGPYRVLIDAPRLPSKSVLEAIRRAAELLQLPRGWNSYDAAPVSQESLREALTFLLEAATTIPNLASPAVVPTAPGGIQLEWHQGGVDIEVEFNPDDPPSWYAEDVASGETAEEVLAPNDATLRVWLARASD